MPFPQTLCTATRCSDQEIVDRFRLLSFGLLLGSLVVSFVLALLVRQRATADGAALLAVTLASFMLASRLLRNVGRVRKYTAEVLGAIAVVVLAGYSGAALALLGLRLHLPLADGALRAADQILGADAVAIVAAMSWQQPWFFRLMSWGYHFTLPTIAATLLILLIFNRVEAWRLVLCFIGTLMTTCAIAIPIPAKGIGVWTPPIILARLPGCSMTCFWPAFDRFYNHANAVLAINSIDGVVSFPSFHAAMGCTVLAAWRINIVTFFVAAVWYVFLMCGTLPYGGHYIVDLIGGCSIWLLWFLLSKRLEQSDFPSPAEWFQFDPIVLANAPRLAKMNAARGPSVASFRSIP